MIIKSNTPLSDNEMRRVQEIMRDNQLTTSNLQKVFPGLRINITDNILWIGNPPWDLTQEIPD